MNTNMNYAISDNELDNVYGGQSGNGEPLESNPHSRQPSISQLVNQYSLSNVYHITG